MGRLAIVEDDDVSVDTSAIVPPNKKCRTNDTCGSHLKNNQKSHRPYMNEAHGKTPKKTHSYKKATQKQRIQTQSSRKTKGISDESGYFEDDVDLELNDGQMITPATAAFFSSPLTRENSPIIPPLAGPQLQQDKGQTHSVETASKDSRESIEIVYDRNAEIYEKSSRGVFNNLQQSHKYLSKTNVFHPKTSSLLKTELLKDQLEYGSNLNQTRGNSSHQQLLSLPMSQATNLISSSTTSSNVKSNVTTASSTPMLSNTATENSQTQSSGKKKVYSLYELLKKKAFFGISGTSNVHISYGSLVTAYFQTKRYCVKSFVFMLETRNKNENERNDNILLKFKYLARSLE